MSTLRKFRKVVVAVILSVAITIWLVFVVLATPTAVAYSDGTLLKDAYSSNIYVMNNDMKVWVRSATVFNNSNYDWTRVKTVSNLSLTPTADLIKTASSQDVYRLEKNFKRKLASTEIFRSYNLNWNKVAVVSQNVLDSYSVAPLIQQIGSPDIFWVQNGTLKHKMTSWQSFVELGFNIVDVIVINDMEMGSYVEGTAVDQNSVASGVCQINQPLVSGGTVCNGIYYKGINIGCYDNKFYEGYDTTQLCKNDSECPVSAPKCFNHRCSMNNPYYYLKINIETPTSVPANTDFKVKINLENTHPAEKLNLIIDNLLFYRFIQYPLVNKAGGGLSPSSDPRNSKETSFTIEPGESKSFEFIFNSKGSITFNAGIYLWIHPPGYAGEVQSQPIIVYDPLMPHSKCGEITYSTRYAACINNILYIAGSEKCSCNADCASGTCYQYYCVNPLSSALTTKPKGDYRAGLVVLYLSDDQDEKREQEDRKKLQQTAIDANEWFRQEISNWNVKDFNITYEKLDCSGITYSSFLNIAKNNKGNAGGVLFEDVARYCNIDRQKYKILGINWEFGQSQDSKPLVDALNAAGAYSGGSGAYYGNGIFTSSMGFFVFPVHETMHAFGLFDLYMSYDGNYIGDAGSEYVWRDCYLMSAKSSKYLSSGHIPLCKLEAFQLGWIK